MAPWRHSLFPMPLDLFKAEKLPAPVAVEHRFIGGPLDGEIHKGTTCYVLPIGLLLTVRGAQYSYRGSDEFEYIGAAAPPAPPAPKLNWKQKTKLRLLHWLFS